MTNLEMNVTNAIELKAQIESLKAQLDEAENNIKAEMVSMEVDKMICLGHVIKYTSVLSSRFDTKGFKEKMGEDVYKAFTKEVPSMRFSIS